MGQAAWLAGAGIEALPLPPEWPEDPWPEIRSWLLHRPHTLFVLDDDPTGTQTVHDVPVWLAWSVGDLQRELARGSRVVYLLTNTRSMPEDRARAVTRRAGRAIRDAAQAADRAVAVASRSDSTLRGHFPAEVEALEEGLGERFDAWILVPYFGEAGRVTLGDVHYVAETGVLVPVAETEFARDPVFGYRSSNLRAWVEEKTGGRVRADQVWSLSLEDVRGGPERVAERLRALPRRCVCVVNLLTARDLAVFVGGLLRAEAGGHRYLYRTAASFIPVRAGLRPRPLLQPEELELAEARGGLVVVGSHVGRTTRQLRLLLSEHPAEPVELEPRALLDDVRWIEEVDSAAERATRGIRAGRDVVVYTGRTPLRGRTPAEDLRIGRRIARGLVEVVRRVRARPRYVLAKGGITAYEVARRGLGIRRAWVVGQIRPGVAVWRLERVPIPYVVFPGNVGDEAALLEVVRALSRV